MRNHNTSSPSKDRRYRDDDRKSERRKQREPDQRNKHRPDEKGSKRYSARTRPEHWGSRQSPSPINDQNFNDHLNAPPQEDPLQDALGKHFNVSAAQAKKFIMQIKNQLHTPVGASGDPAFPISTPTTNTASSNFVDSKPTTAKLQNNIGIRDRTNEQTLAFQAYQSQLQAQYLQQQQQQQSNQPTSQGMQINNDAALQEMVSRQMQQEQFSRQQQPVGVANPYFQQQSATLQYDNATLGQIGNQGYVNPSAGGLNAQVLTQSQQAQLNSLIQNGTTYFQQIDGKRNY